MTDDQFDLEDLAAALGIDNQLVDGLEAEELREEKLKILERVVEMYLNQPEDFADFVSDSGLEELMAKLDDVEVKQIQTEDGLSNLQQEVESKAQETELDLDLDI